MKIPYGTVEIDTLRFSPVLVEEAIRTAEAHGPQRAILDSPLPSGYLKNVFERAEIPEDGIKGRSPLDEDGVNGFQFETLTVFGPRFISVAPRHPSINISRGAREWLQVEDGEPVCLAFDGNPWLGFVMDEEKAPITPDEICHAVIVERSDRATEARINSTKMANVLADRYGLTERTRFSFTGRLEHVPSIVLYELSLSTDA